MRTDAFKLTKSFNDHYPLFVQFSKFELKKNNIAWNLVFSIHEPYQANNKLIELITIPRK